MRPGGRAGKAASELVTAETSDRPSRGWITKLVLSLAVGALIFEQSPANEALRTWLGLEVLDRTRSEWLVGAAIFGVTMLIEGVSSLLIVAGLHLPSKLVRRLTDRLGSVETAAPNRSRGARVGGILTDASLALGVGAGLVVMRRHLRMAQPKVGTDARVGVNASLVVAVVSGAIGVLAAGGIRHADKIGLGTPARWFVDYATDWRFWLVVFFVVQLVGIVKRIVRKCGRQREIDAVAEGADAAAVTEV